MALSYHTAEVRQLMDCVLNTISLYVLLSFLWATKGTLHILILVLILALALNTSEATDLANRQRPQRSHSRPRRLRRWSLPPRRQRSWLRPPGSRGRGAAAPVPRGRLRAGDRGRSSQLTYCSRSIASSSLSNIRGRCLATEIEINGRLGS